MEPENKEPLSEHSEPVVLKKYQELADGQTISRVIKPRLLLKDRQTNAVIGCFPEAFRLRDEEIAIRAISVNIMDIFPGTKIQKLSSVRNHLALSLTDRHALAVMNVGAVLTLGKSVGLDLRVTYNPTKDTALKKGDPSHSRITRMPIEDHDIFALLANLASTDLTLSKDIP